MRKIRNMPEKETLKAFQKYERLNLKTRMVHESQKVDGMIKEIDPKTHQKEGGRSPATLLQKKGSVDGPGTPPDEHKTELLRLYEAKIQWRNDVELHKSNEGSNKTVVRMDQVGKTSGYINELN